jgi:hypothetical protein
MAPASTVRVSIALLVPLINTVYIGTHDKNSLFQKGIEIITALGGAALLHDREYCVKTFGAFDFEKNDTRFRIPEEKLNAVMESFRYLDADLFETNPFREIYEELIEEAPALNRLLSGGDKETHQYLDKEDLDKIRFEYLGRIEEVPSGVEQTGLITCRVLHNFRMIAPSEVKDKILQQPCIRQLSVSEINSRMTIDGIPIKDNLHCIDRLMLDLNEFTHVRE